MWGIRWAMGWLILGLGVAPSLAQPAGEAEEALRGTWSATSAQRDGTSAADVVGHRLVFAGHHFRIESRDGKLLYEGTVRLDPERTPAAVDFQHTAGALKGARWKGIYALRGDTLSVCDNAPDLNRPRPATFAAPVGSGYVAITFQRVRDS